MKNAMLRLLTFMLGLGTICSIAACAPTLGHVYMKIENVPSDKALVYIYRPSSFIGGGVYYDVKANGKVATTLYNGGYYPYVAEPGEIEFSAKTEATASVTIDAKSGQTHYIKGGVGVGFVVGRPRLRVVTANIAEQEIKECKLIPEVETEKQN